MPVTVFRLSVVSATLIIPLVLYIGEDAGSGG